MVESGVETDPMEEKIDRFIPPASSTALFRSCVLSYGVKTYRGRGVLKWDNSRDVSDSRYIACAGKLLRRPGMSDWSALSIGEVGLSPRCLDG